MELYRYPKYFPSLKSDGYCIRITDCGHTYYYLVLNEDKTKNIFAEIVIDHYEYGYGTIFSGSYEDILNAIKYSIYLL